MREHVTSERIGIVVAGAARDLVCRIVSKRRRDVVAVGIEAIPVGGQPRDAVMSGAPVNSFIALISHEKMKTQ